MPAEIKVPSAGESITSAIVSAWHKGNGDPVKVGDLLVTIDTDKVSTELTAEADGILEIRTQPGEEVTIGAVIGLLHENTGAAPAPEAPAPAPAAEKAPEPPAAKEETPRRESPPADAASEPPSPPSAPASPAPAAAPVQDSPPAARADLTVLPKAETPSAPDPEGRITRRKMTPLRRKIATHLVNAQHTAAILTTFNEVDMTEVINLRKLVQAGFVERHGVKLGFMSFFLKAVVEALKSVPQVNARIDGDEIVEHHYYDIGVAVGTDRGLVVPVIRDCDRKSFAELEKEIADYAKRARDGRITIDDLQGGVFTISNGGIYGSLLSTPILNPPQSAILGMHAIQERPVAVDGKVEIRPMMYLALSYDHRLIDGREAVTFLLRVRDCIQQPGRLLLGA